METQTPPGPHDGTIQRANDLGRAVHRYDFPHVTTGVHNQRLRPEVTWTVTSLPALAQ